MGVVIFNGRASLDYGIHVEHPPDYQMPERDYEVVHIPGRNGDLIIDNGSYQNVTRSYEVSFADMGRIKPFTTMANAVAEWIHSASGYARLEDTYEPEYYRMAMYMDEVEIENIVQHAGRATVEFNCKPQRFLKSGEETKKMTASGILNNPTNFTAKPCITVYGNGSGTVIVGGYIVSISEIGGYLVIDSDIQDAYRQTVNCNNNVTLGNGFPVLRSGENKISWTGGVSYVEVIPRWWTL